MLTDMKLVPHSHFGMPGDIQKHTLVYTVVIAIFLTIFFDLSRIASLGAIFYIIMDIFIHWGVYRYLRKEVNANGFVVLAAIAFDVIVLGAFLIVKASTDMLVIYAALIGIAVIFVGERFFLKWQKIPKSKKELYLRLRFLGHFSPSYSMNCITIISLFSPELEMLPEANMKIWKVARSSSLCPLQSSRTLPPDGAVAPVVLGHEF